MFLNLSTSLCLTMNSVTLTTTLKGLKARAAFCLTMNSVTLTTTLNEPKGSNVFEPERLTDRISAACKGWCRVCKDESSICYVAGECVEQYSCRNTLQFTVATTITTIAATTTAWTNSTAGPTSNELHVHGRHLRVW